MTLTLTATTLIAVYAALCWLLPFGACRRCASHGHHTTLITRRLRPCRRCHGSGRRLRYGRRAFNYLARVHADAANRRTPNR
ncbi:MAG TPA: hypothetical protein VK453_13940 [Micromonosporaceae bacterium]|nr:hypothetical protein [Micromonosporaceae bacterium]